MVECLPSVSEGVGLIRMDESQPGMVVFTFDLITWKLEGKGRLVF